MTIKVKILDIENNNSMEMTDLKACMILACI